MKLTDWKPRSIFSSRTSQERDKFLQDSLASSFVLSESLANWASGHDPRSSLCVMKFDEEWQSPNCAVMEWYKGQNCKKFKSIQHWRNVDTQFFHEFLIIKLIDGSACRVERMGEGSRADAIRYVGCSAFDLIQWFSDKDHATKRWSRGSDELIIEVEFPNQFDLLDVLAVCYTIQHRSPRASVYTLQRYNCYFLCNTIFAVLARRVAQWETLITDLDWPALVLDIIDQLKRKSQAPVQQQAANFLALGVCSLLNPDSTNPAGFLLDAYRSELENNAGKHLNGKLAAGLWYKHVNLSIITALFEDKMSCTLREHMSGDPDPTSAVSRFLALVGDNNGDEGHSPFKEPASPAIQKAVSTEFLHVWCVAIKNILVGMNEVRRMRELEEKPSLKRRLGASIFGTVASVSMPLAEYMLPDAFQTLKDNLDFWCKRYNVTAMRLISALPWATKADCTKILLLTDNIGSAVEYALCQDSASNDPDTLVDWMTVAIAQIEFAAERLVSMIQSFLKPRSGPSDVPGALMFLSAYFPEVLWDLCFMVCVSKLDQSRFHSLLSLRAGTLVTHSMDMNKTQMLTTVQTVADFQTQIKQNIQNHAARVQRFQLAAATLVQNDIERSMTEVWKSLPAGFGAREVENPHPPRRLNHSHRSLRVSLHPTSQNRRGIPTKLK